VKLSHDATCVPSTSIDHDGHTERPTTIVPGEPTGQSTNKQTAKKEEGCDKLSVYLGNLFLRKI